MWLWRVHNGVSSRVGNPTWLTEEDGVLMRLSSSYGIGSFIPNPPEGKPDMPSPAADPNISQEL
jgi:hypothetical protein